MTTNVDLKIVNIPSRKRVRITRLIITGLIIWAILVIVQSLWFFEQQNQVATLLTLAGGIIGVIIFFNANLMTAYPISMTMMVGYVSYYFLLPPLATLLEGKSLSNNLLHPAQDLLHAFICLLFLLLAFAIYRKSSGLQKLRWFISRKIYKQIGFFNITSNTQLLTMGALGILAMGYQTFVAGGYQQAPVGTINKFIQGFYPLAYLPYVTLVKRLIGKWERTNRIWLLILSGYTVLLGIVSLARNSRAALFSGIASILLAYLYGLATGVYKLSKSGLRNMALVAITIIILSGPFTDLALSMVVVRGARTDISAKELVFETIETFQNKAALERYRKNAIGIKLPLWYDWSYVDNIFMDRLSNLKFADISLDIALSIGKPAKNYLREIEAQKVLAIFPQPIVNLLGLPVDKDLVTKASSGDFMIFAGTGNRYALGRYQQGSIFGNGYALFGWGYPFIIAAVMVILFPLADASTSKRLITKLNQDQRQLVTILSPIVIASLFTWFVYLTSGANGAEAISSLVTYLIRGWIQVAFIYGISYWITYFPAKIINFG